MANVWGKNSLRNYETLDHRLQYIADEVLEMRDISIIAGHRGKNKQNEYFKKGVSKVKWPNGKHNKLPSHAMDVQPAPYYKETLREDLFLIAGLIIATGKAQGIEIRWGGDWNRDGKTTDNTFDDLFHFELTSE